MFSKLASQRVAPRFVGMASRSFRVPVAPLRCGGQPRAFSDLAAQPVVRAKTLSLPKNLNRNVLLAMGVSSGALLWSANTWAKAEEKKPEPPAAAPAPVVHRDTVVKDHTGKEYELASWSQRIWAKIYGALYFLGRSVVFVVIPAAIISVGFGSGLAAGIYFFVAGLGVYIHTVFIEFLREDATPDGKGTLNGQGWGDKRAGTQVVRLDGKKVTIGTVFIHQLGAAIANTIPGADILVGFLNDKRQCVHNLASDTIVIRAPNAPKDL